MKSQKELYLYNRDRIDDSVNHDSAYLAFENDWIRSNLLMLEKPERSISYKEMIDKMEKQIQREASAESQAADYVSRYMTRDELSLLVQEFAVDGLTEAQVFYYVMPRLPLEAQLPMLRIMIDEFGSANPKRMHTQLFANLLTELGLSTQYQDYLDQIDDVSYEFLNMYFWLTLRADDASYFVGALTYLETIIPVVFPVYVDACKRLKIQAHDYYSEHCHIDDFHAVECQRVLKQMHATNTLNPIKAWQGFQLSSLITNRVFDCAVEKAMRLGSMPGSMRNQTNEAAVEA